MRNRADQSSGLLIPNDLGWQWASLGFQYSVCVFIVFSLANDLQILGAIVCLLPVFVIYGHQFDRANEAFRHKTMNVPVMSLALQKQGHLLIAGIGPSGAPILALDSMLKPHLSPQVSVVANLVVFKSGNRSPLFHDTHLTTGDYGRR